MGFEHHNHDQCVMYKKMDGGNMIVFVIYVDDILAFYSDEKEAKWLRQKLEEEYETIVVETGREFTYLGMVLQQLEDGSIYTHMDGYISKLIEEYLVMRKIKGSKMPAGADLFNVDDESDILLDKNRQFFQKIVAKLLYLCRRVRVDNAGCTVLCTRVRELKKQN